MRFFNTLQTWARSSPKTFVFAAAVIVAIAVALLSPADWSGGDFASFYDTVGSNIAAGAGIREGDGSFATRYPPGYPLYLAGLYRIAAPLGVSKTNMIVAGNVLVTALTAVIVFVWAERLWPRWAMLAPALWMSFPPALSFLARPSSETPFCCALVAALLLFWDALTGGRIFAAAEAGLLLGIATLIRPFALGLPVVLAGFVLFAGTASMRSRMMRAAALMACYLLTLGPWEMSMFRHTGKFAVVSTFGIRSVRDGLTFAVESKGYREPQNLSPRVESAMREFRARYSEMISYGGIARVLADIFRQNPAGVGELFVVKALRSWYATDSGRDERMVGMVSAPFWLLILAASWIAFRRGGNAGLYASLSWTLILYSWLMTISVLSIARYTTPATAFALTIVPAVLPQKARRAEVLRAAA